MQREILMTLFEDIALALRHVATDALPTSNIDVFVQVEPPAVVLRIPGETNVPIQRALMELATGFKKGTEETFPSLPLQYRVIGGSQAAGIEITPKPGAEPVYGNVIKAKMLWWRPSEWLRRQRPNLPERITL